MMLGKCQLKLRSRLAAATIIRHFPGQWGWLCTLGLIHLKEDSALIVEPFGKGLFWIRLP